MVNIKLHPLLTVRQPSLTAKFNFEGKNILTAFQDHRLKEMLYASSPSLFREYQLWEKGKIHEKRELKLIESLYKYSLRMRFRSTPFGLLSEVYTIDKAKLKDGIRRRSVKRVSRLDTQLIQQLISKIEQLEGISAYLQYRRNNSIYEVKNEIRYLKLDYNQPGKAAEINKLTIDPILKEVLHFCRLPRCGKQISDLLQKYCEHQTERESYLNQLIELQLIQSNLKISLSEGDQLSRIIKIIQAIKIKGEYKNREMNSLYGELVRLQLRLIRIDQSSRKRISAYKALKKQLINMGLKVDEGSFIQINQFANMEAADSQIEVELPKETELNQLVSWLVSFLRSNSNERLIDFKARFQRRYGDYQASVLEVMDPEIGLGYANHSSDLMGNSPLLQDLLLHRKKGLTAPNRTRFPLAFQEKLSDALRNGDRVLKVDPNSLNGRHQKVKLPLSFSALIKVVELENGEVAFLLKDLGGHHAAHYLGRFIDDSKEFARLARDIAKHEESCHPDSKMVQCYHSYASRAANISNRPALYGASLHLLDNQSHSTNNIEWKHIHVKVENDRIALLHNKDNLAYIPRISSAMDFRINTLPLHHFLGDLQSQDRINDLNFYWGEWENNFRRLPRLQVGRFIIQPEQWHFDSNALKTKLNKSNFKHWCVENRLPNRCLFINGDQELLLNFDHAEAKDLFFSLIKKNDEILLHEYLEPKKGLIQDLDGNQLEHEIILSLLNQAEKRSKSYKPIQNELKIDLQKPLPQIKGNPWLYFKAYTTPLNTEKVLEKLYPKINRFKRKKWIDEWFFIRYGDPDHHLRLRFKSGCEEMQNQLLPKMKSALETLQAEGLVWKIVLDQYQPEINRYGKHSMSLCEHLFHWDSESIVRFIHTFKGHKRELMRWQMAVLLIQEWFELFKLSNTERKHLLESWCASFKQEPQFKRASKQSLAKQWRAKRACIDQLIKKGKLRELDTKLLSAISAEKSLKSYPFTDTLLHLGETGRIGISRIDLLNSLCHMSCNRLFPHGARANEFVIYDLMWNYYRSEIARKKKLKQN